MNRSMRQNEPIAIIGIGCRLPGGANDADSYWNLLREGVDAVTDIPADRWDPRLFYDPVPGKPGKTDARWGGFIEGIDQFDAAFFGISPREAARMDPQQRLLMEVAWEALEDAGLTLERVANTKTAVFAGISSYDYMNLQAVGADRSGIDVYSNTGGAFSIAANRISYFFNFKGPSAAVDTACSSALVGVHLACQSIWHEGCTMALAGGVNVLLMPDGYIGFSRLSMLSPDGRCKAFDSRANGFVRSEGAGMVVLKPLARALADNDRIYALIRATAVNQDGRTPGMTVPSQQSQAALVRDACRQAGILPGEIQYVEAHGTGTQVGDPIEAQALGEELSVGRPEGNCCLIGSVKTNIGHLESAAGIAGLIKVALALKHRQVPANLHFLQPNPDIPLDALRLRIPRTLEPWPEGDAAGLAGINSFGFGGTNAHAILQGPPCENDKVTGWQGDRGATDDKVTRRQGDKMTRERNGVPSFGHPVTLKPCHPVTVSPCHLLPLSARTPEALKALALSYQHLLKTRGDTISLADLCFNASMRRSHLGHRLALVAHNREDLLGVLAAYVAGESNVNVVLDHVAQGPAAGLAFICSGQGPQWWAMGRQLLTQEPVFRAVIERCDNLVQRLGGWSLWHELTAEEAESRLHETAIAQPAIFALQVGLAALWQSWGIVPDAVIGHSVGEVAAAHIAGVLSLSDAVQVIFHRGRCMDLAHGEGKMLAVGLSLEEARGIILPHGKRVGIAAINSPTSISLSGDAIALEEIANELQQRDVFCRFLAVQYAFHSYQMDPVKEPLLASLRGIRPQPAQIPLFSSVTGQRVAGPEWDADYWWQNVRQSVRFTDAVDRLMEINQRHFVELSPHPVLASAVLECLTQHGYKGKVLPSLRRKEEERATMLRSLGALHCLGRAVAWNALAPQAGRFVRLPPYPWQHERFWHEPEEAKCFRLPTIAHPLLGHQLPRPTPSWESNLEPRLLPYLDDHRVRGHVVLPGTAYLEMALAAGKAALDDGCSVLEEVQMVKACFLPEGQAQTLQTVVNPADLTFTIYGRSQDKWVVHARGLLRSRAGEVSAAAVCLEEIKARCPSEISSSDCYAQLKDMGLEYGPTFRGVQRLWQGEIEALAQIQVHDDIHGQADDYLLHPALLDTCLHAIFGLPGVWARKSSDNRGVHLPVEIEQVRVHGRLSGPLWCHAVLVEKNRQGLVANVRVFHENGKLLIEARGLRCQSVGDGDNRDTLDDLLYEYEWKFQPRAGQAAAARGASRWPSPSTLAPGIQADAQRLRTQQRVKERYEQLDSRRDVLCTSLIWKAFEQLGADLRPGQSFTAGELAEKLDIVPRHHRLLDRFLGILEEDGFIRRPGGVTPPPNSAVWEVVSPPGESNPQETWRALVAEHPAFIAELIILGRCGQHLAQVLRGEINPLEIIFPEGDLTTAEHFYQDSPCQRFYHSVAQHALARLLDHFPKDRPIRILEIGAGTGGLTSYLLPLLPAGRTEYLFTDLSNHFFNKAEQKFRDFPFVQYQRLDIEIDAGEQGFEAHSFDLILASQVLHATTDLRHTLFNVHQLLAPDGLLLLLEAVRPPRWFDLVFGLTEGWWRFADAPLRTSHPLLAFPTWQELLAEAGFTEPTDLCQQDGEKPFESAVILAHAGDDVTEECPVARSLAHPLTVPPDQPPGSWLIFADQGGVASKLAELLTAQGESCTLVGTGETFERRAADHFQIAPAKREDMQELLKQLALDERPAWRGTIHLWNLDAPAATDACTDSLMTAQTIGCLSVVHLLQAWTEVWGNQSPRLWLITGGAHSVAREDQPVALAQTPSWGLGRVIGNEFPQFHCKMVDLRSHVSIAEAISLFEELCADEPEDEIALRGNARYVHRLTHRPTADCGLMAPATQVDSSFRLEVSRTGTLDGLKLRSVSRRSPGPGEVEIQVCAAGLNFSDVMKALGLYPGLPDGPVPLGIECSGKVVAVGAGVEEFQVNDEVVAIAPFTFSAFLTLPALLVARKPAHLTFEEAATLPIAFLTADYALNHMGRLEEGERVLIHSATGGVGLAAIQVARKAGAEIFATAGTPEKREFLNLLGIRHVMDSRSLDFADEVMEYTGGKGVDIILNSLAGEAISKGLAALADHGRFLEIGKRDIYQNSRLGLGPFRKNLSMIAIDLDRALRERPKQIGACFRQLIQDVELRALAPLPHRVFAISNAAGAFRHMAQAKHLGKVVLSLQDQTTAIAPSSEEPMTTFRADATYLITGGLGGFGLTVAQWLVDNGARHLVLASRRGSASPETQQAIAALEGVGAQVLIAKADVSLPDETATLLARITQDMPPLAGIVHAAMVLDDCLLLNLNQERLERVLAPKMSGAWNLHAQTLQIPLDFFVLFSSMSCVFGIPGQGNYAAANAFLDALAHYRRARGLPGLTINWGYLGNVGYVARNEKIGERFEQLGVTSFTPGQALELLGRLLRQDASQVGVMRVNWAQQRKMFVADTVPPKFARLYEEAASETAASTAEGVPTRKALLAVAPEQRKQLMQEMLRDKVARVLGSAAGKLDIDKPLTEVGLDSLMAVELRNWIESDLRLNLPIVELMRGPSVARLADILLEQISAADAPSPPASPAPAIPAPPRLEHANGQAKKPVISEEAEVLLNRIDDLSNQEVDDLLASMLADQEHDQ